MTIRTITNTLAIATSVVVAVVDATNTTVVAAVANVTAASVTTTTIRLLIQLILLTHTNTTPTIVIFFFFILPEWVVVVVVTAVVVLPDPDVAEFVDHSVDAVPLQQFRLVPGGRLDVVLLQARHDRAVEEGIPRQHSRHQRGVVVFDDAGVDPGQIVIDRPLGVLDLDVLRVHRGRILAQHQPEVTIVGPKVEPDHVGGPVAGRTVVIVDAASPPPVGLVVPMGHLQMGPVEPCRFPVLDEWIYRTQ